MRSSPQKSLLMLILLALLAGCLPAAPTPVQPLDPNAIGTIIISTAHAAATQTAQAIALQATPTFTSTSLPTFTPEATYTAVAPITFPTVAPVQDAQYFRFRHDNQLAYYNFRSRTAATDWPVEKWGLQTPEMVELFVNPKFGSGTHRTKLDSFWEAFIDKLNGYNPRKLHYVKADDTALFDGAGFPQLESVSMGGNIVTLDEIKNGWGRVHTFDFNNPGPLDDVNYTTRPDLVHKFILVAWNRNGQYTYFTDPPPPYGDLYWPLVSTRAVWVSMEFLEAFPLLPMTVKGVIEQEIKVKPEADSASTGYKLGVGESVRIVEYHPAGSDVWARVAGGGWIALLLNPKTVVTYMTDWEMATRPPLPPPAPAKP